MCLASMQAAKDTLAVAKKVQAAARSLSQRVEKLQSIRGQQQKEIEKARKAANVDLADCTSVDQQLDAAKNDKVVGPQLRYDDPGGDTVKHNSLATPIPDARNARFSHGLPDFLHMPQGE